MPPDDRSIGRLIAIEGGSEADAAKLANQTADSPDAPAQVSLWNASQVFHDLELNGAQFSPKTLLTLYAADLAHRLRWQIEPARAAGRNIVVADYVDTALAFAAVTGVAKAWAAGLFRFAPKADEVYYVASKEDEENWEACSAGGFLGFACAHLATQSTGWRPPEMRKSFVALLRKLPAATI